MKQGSKLTKKPTTKTPLYRHVFYGRFSTVVVFVLLVSILLQPIDRARAGEIDSPVTTVPIDTSQVVTATIDPPALPNLVTDSGPELAVPPAAIPEISTNPTVENENTPPTNGNAVAVSSTTEQILLDVEATTSPIYASSTTVESGTPQNSATATPVTYNESNSTSSVSSSTNLNAPKVDSNEQDISTGTDVVIEKNATSSGEVIEAKAAMISDSQIQFDKTDCVAVADGSYYCKTKAAESTSDIKDGLYSKPDSDGDLEIYFAHSGSLEQITHNVVDDASPYYDAVSDTIVWHRLLNDRYQIISYDVSSGAESILTTDTVNNMEPTRSGRYTAWQHWNKDNWDIMLNDGSATKLLSTSLDHDIAPKIKGNLVMWNRLARDTTQTIELYDLISGEYTSIADDEGGELSNPRMVLVYDAEFKNGDIVTKGYDVVTGKIAPLSALPVKIPDKIPAPDETGETRALIQGKNSSREDVEIATPTPTIDPPHPGDASTASSTPYTATSTDVIIQPFDQLSGLFSGTSSLQVATTAPRTLDLTSTTTLPAHITDVVVPSFSASSSITQVNL